MKKLLRYMLSEFGCWLAGADELELLRRLTDSEEEQIRLRDEISKAQRKTDDKETEAIGLRAAGMEQEERHSMQLYILRRRIRQLEPFQRLVGDDKPPEWTPADVSAFEGWLATAVGQRQIKRLFYHASYRSEQANGQAHFPEHAAGVALGYRMAITDLISMGQRETSPSGQASLSALERPEFQVPPEFSYLRT